MSEPDEWNTLALKRAADELVLTDREPPVEMGPSIQMTARQRLVFDAAMAVLRNRVGVDLSEGRAVELWAAQFLSGV